MRLMKYEVTALLCNAKKQTGVTFELDSELEGDEFVVVSKEPRQEPSFEEDEIDKFLISPSNPWNMTVFLVSMTRITENPLLSILSTIPIIRQCVMLLMCRKVAKTLL